MSSVQAIAGGLLIAIGLAFDLFGCLGLVRLPDIYNRLQAATKCVTLGTCSVLLGVLVLEGFNGAGLKSLLCAVFLVLTAPVAAHAISRGSHRAGFRPWEGTVMDAYAEDAKDRAPDMARGEGAEGKG